jgi:hypothetical protein
LKKGDIINYVHSDLEKIDGGIVTNIILSKKDNKTLKSIRILNKEKNTSWKIVPQKYHIFKVIDAKQSITPIKKGKKETRIENFVKGVIKDKKLFDSKKMDIK